MKLCLLNTEHTECLNIFQKELLICTIIHIRQVNKVITQWITENWNWFVCFGCLKKRGGDTCLDFFLIIYFFYCLEITFSERSDNVLNSISGKIKKEIRNIRNRNIRDGSFYSILFNQLWFFSYECMFWDPLKTSQEIYPNIINVTI